MHSRNARLGLWLFAMYLAFYGGFVLLAAFRPAALEATPLAGVNMAVWYGFGLIVGALALACVYGWLCRTEEQPPAAVDAVAPMPSRENAVRGPR